MKIARQNALRKSVLPKTALATAEQNATSNHLLHSMVSSPIISFCISNATSGHAEFVEASLFEAQEEERFLDSASLHSE
jgi:hypothetical protein